MRKLLDILNDLESKVSNLSAKNSGVSQASVAWHIEHSLLVIIQVIESIKMSDPNKYHWRFNKSRFMVFLFQKFPRGRSKAPKSVIPSLEINAISLQLSFEKARASIGTLNGMHPNQYFTNPYLGQLNIKYSTSFLAIHTMHHLKIIRDILL